LFVKEFLCLADDRIVVEMERAMDVKARSVDGERFVALEGDGGIYNI
jgi:hypothetical protein